MLKILRTHGFIIPVAVFLVLFAGVWVIGYHLAGHNATYPLDDTYIHIAIAKQLAETGTWGVTPGEYAFCSSSPLWTVILAICYRLSGVSTWLPGVLATISAALVLFFADRFWRLTELPVGLRVFLGLLLALVTPLAVLAHLGMEHALHTACMVALMGTTLQVLAGQNSRRAVIELCVVAALSTGVRYESLFVIGPLVCLLFWERRSRLGLTVGVAAAVPVVIYGVYAWVHMGHFLPTTLLIKGCLGVTRGPFDGVFELAGGIQGKLEMHVVLLSLLATVVFPSVPLHLRKLAFVCIIATCAQFVLAGFVTPLYRYEAYLVAVGFVVTVASMWKTVRSADWRGLRVFVLSLFVPVLLRAGLAHYASVRAPREICGQQVQLARIFSSLPETQKGVVAINDLGYFSLYAGCPLVDLWGLGSWDVGEALLNDQGTSHSLIYKAALDVHKARYVAVFDEWYPRSMLPSNLFLVAKLVITYPRVVCGGAVVSLYVVQISDFTSFRSHLKEIEPTLPKGTRILFETEITDRVTRK